MDPKLHASVFAPQRRVGRRRANREKRRRRRASVQPAVYICTGACSLSSASIRPRSGSLNAQTFNEPDPGPTLRCTRGSTASVEALEPTHAHRNSRETRRRRAVQGAILPSVPKRDAPVRPIRHVADKLLVHEPDRAPHAPAPTRQRGVGVSSRRCNKQQTCLVGRNVLRQN